MLKIGHVKDTLNLNNIPKEVKEVVVDITMMLDGEYGENRNIESDDGGYIIIIENKEDFNEIGKLDIEINDLILESVDLIKVREGEDYINVLSLFTNEFGLTLLVPRSLADKELLDELNE
ncbi:MAG: hypothetical protein FH753_06820 [Firmicutes bacterium]|nr:hypothetical protein [Bacillota bacterium]